MIYTAKALFAAEFMRYLLAMKNEQRVNLMFFGEIYNKYAVLC